MAEIFTEDILIEILLRLPAKSLMRFKCVGKRWRSLISNPGFAKSHLQRLMARDLIPSQRIFKTSPFESIDYELHDGGIGGDDDLAVVKVHELRIGDPYWEPELVGSCHGLVCLLVPGRFFLYNPTTKESRNFPCSDLVQQDALVNGFGYDPRSDDYKIVQAGGLKSGKRQYFRSSPVLGEGHKSNEKAIPTISTKEFIRMGPYTGALLT
ncbi:F-box/kelch-repeat protein At3g23880-like [Eucalyptus grandis]|uniref:F-box/kelch-repeat protein At3g23880-like n=1 Tax=Eucalyptus grandis TaxID=71139 RepID=UPI00192F0546|nr:F-box/kelch-repeat protein At3g23880-like [Eucalyptus grandis]